MRVSDSDLPFVAHFILTIAFFTYSKKFEVVAETTYVKLIDA